jgi:protein-L-isoaspartate(D-aspartate) O-methyltransferase
MVFMKIDYKNANLTKEKRRQLIEQLRLKGISDEKVLDAMLEIPRELFMNPETHNQAYDDNAFPIDYGQTISQPYTVAFMTQLLKVECGNKILEIGTGSGYQAALLYMLGAKVFTIERIKELYEKSTRLFRDYNLSINSRLGDGTIGWNQYSPFDGIIVTAGAPSVPKTLQNQLNIGGRLVIPVGDNNTQSMLVIERLSEDKFETNKFDYFKFVPLIGKEGWNNK